MAPVTGVVGSVLGGSGTPAGPGTVVAPVTAVVGTVLGSLGGAAPTSAVTTPITSVVTSVTGALGGGNGGNLPAASLLGGLLGGGH